MTAMAESSAEEPRNVQPVLFQVLQRLGRAKRQPEQQQHLPGVDEHDAHQEESRPSSEHIVVGGQGPDEVEVDDPAAAVCAQQLRRDDCGKYEEEHRHDLVVVLVARKVHEVHQHLAEQPRHDREYGRGRHYCEEEQDWQHLGHRAASQAEAGADAVYEQRLPCAVSPLPGAVVVEIAEVEYLAF